LGRFGVWTRSPKQDQGHDRRGQHEQSADGGSELKRLNECVAGSAEQLRASPTGQLMGYGHGTAECAARCLHQLRRDTVRDYVRHRTAVDGRPDAALPPP
jgi:hypothetical protein